MPLQGPFFRSATIRIYAKNGHLYYAVEIRGFLARLVDMFKPRPSRCPHIYGAARPTAV